MTEAWTLKDTNAIVTGATRGIGRAIVEEFASHHARLLIVARNSTDVSSMSSELMNLGHEVMGVSADVSTPEGRAFVLQRCRESWGRVDVLVNNVGTNILKKTLEYTLDDLRYLMAVNVESAFDMSRLFYPLLIKAKDGASVINISSMASQRVVPFTTAAYSMSKAALEQMTNCLAVEWGKDNIRVNSVHPWYVDTQMASLILGDQAIRAKVVAQTPLGRIATATDVANVVSFLAMPASSYLSGVNIPIDGAVSKRGI